MNLIFFPETAQFWKDWNIFLQKTTRKAEGHHYVMVMAFPRSPHLIRFGVFWSKINPPHS